MAQRAQSHEGTCTSSVAQKEKRNSNTCEEHKKPWRGSCAMPTAIIMWAQKPKNRCQNRNHESRY